MQRILSVETSRNASTTTEFVSKRLCFSLLFSVGFTFLLGGYLLGRYTTDRALIMKKAYIQQLLMEEKTSGDIMKNITLSMKSIKNITTNVPFGTYSFSELYEKLKCTEFSSFHSNFTHFESNVSVDIYEILYSHLDGLNNCFNSIDTYLRNITSRVSVASL